MKIPPPVPSCPPLPRPRLSAWAFRVASLTVLIASSVELQGAAPLRAQEASLEQGVVGAGLLLRQMDGHKRVLMVAAHPDDEDTALLAALARGMGAQTAYLSLTRGDGGQNLIGPELFEGLGAIRTEELLAARALDGASQYFTRAFDYGFSKNAEEAFSMWPHDEVLADVVRVVRAFRPQVVVARFSGTPADGHGQHQAAGILAREAFEAAADPSRFPEQLAAGLEPWQPSLLYGRATGENPTVSVATGRFDPLLGRSTYQLAMESRSRHSSQGMGAAQPAGGRTTDLELVRTAPGVTREGDDFFAGVDTTLAGLTTALRDPLRGATVDRLTAYRAALDEARTTLSVLDPWRAAPPLARALTRIVEARDALASVAGVPGELREALALRERLTSRALLEVSGVVADVRVSDDLLVPGEEARVEVQLWNGGPYSLTDVSPSLRVPAGWSVLGPEPLVGVPGGDRFGGGGPAPAPAAGADPGEVSPGEIGRWAYRVTVPATAEPSKLYYLEAPRDGALYRWPEDPALLGLPRDPSPVEGGASAILRLPGVPGTVAVETARAGTFVDVDQASGEFRHHVLVVPALSLALDPPTLVWPLGSGETRTVTLTVTSHLEERTARGTLSLGAPTGWEVEPSGVAFELEPGATTSQAFVIRPPAEVGQGRFTLAAEARTESGEVYREGLRLLEYPHIERIALYEPAELHVTAVSALVADDLSVGYVMGSGDTGPEALRQLGVRTELLEGRALLDGDLSRFDVIVVGVRAYETRPDLRAANARVLDFARQGGTVVVQYNQYQWSDGGFAPYPLEIARPHDRVTDEEASVRLLEPTAPPLAAPNRITNDDFEGWVTERGLYFPGRWDSTYVPLLEMADPGEDPLRGALLVAPLGEGLYVYTGLSLFRQLPQGVPGAYRLLANLVSLTAEAWRRRVPASDF